MQTTDERKQERSGSKRFVRPDDLPEFKMTSRNLGLLAQVARYRLISSDDLALLDGGSAQKAKRELRTLWAHGYIVRPAAQLKTVAITGPQPIVYGLSNRGARLLKDHGHLVDISIDWSENSRRAGISFIDHSVARSRFMAAVEVAVRNADGIQLLEAHDIIARAPERTRRSKHPLKWTAIVPDEQGRDMPSSVISDDMFALTFADGTASYFLVEIDRGQMPVRRNGAAAEEVIEGKRRVRTHYRHKLATYYHGWRQRRHEEQFGIEQLRVLTITTSATRVETMIDALGDVTNGRGSDLFLFIDEASLQSTNPLSLTWISGKRSEVRLTD